MTISEEITSLISQKYFLKQYIFDNLLVKENDLSEKELCDCLLEFIKSTKKVIKFFIY